MILETVKSGIEEKKAVVIKAPDRKYKDRKDSVFLAGSIEMGKAEHWQVTVEKALTDLNINIFNPRRDDWDSSWKQTIENEQFHAQVKWEFDHIEKCSIFFLYFDPATQSPISLMELGLVAAKKDKTIIVVCPEGFWRKGNVEFICKQFNLPLHTDLESGIKSLLDALKR
jgi:hypothetical protein